MASRIRANARKDSPVPIPDRINRITSLSGKAKPLPSSNTHEIIAQASIVKPPPASLLTANIRALSLSGTDFPRISIQGTFVIPIQEVTNTYITINVMSRVNRRSAPIHIVLKPAPIQSRVRTVPATTNTGILQGRGSAVREMSTCGQVQPIRIRALASPTITRKLLRF